jgi:hypothetical protein
MSEARNGAAPAAPVVRMLMGLKKEARTVKLERRNIATIEDFELQQMGVAAKE